MVKIMNEAGAFPTRYWTKGSYTEWPKIGAEALHERCTVKSRACLKCFMACGRLTTIQQGRHTGLTLEGPEYETIYAFGGLCQINNIEEIDRQPSAAEHPVNQELSSSCLIRSIIH